MSGRKEDTFVVVDVSPACIRLGVGVHDVIASPRLEVPSVVARKESGSSNDLSGYLAGYALQQAENAGQQLQRIHPLVWSDNSVGISDWPAFEALLRYTLFTALALPSRPLGYHILLLFPASLSDDDREKLTQLLFEKLHLSAAMMFDRPTAMLYAAGLLSGLVIDIFPRSTELCFIADNNIVTQLSNPFGEDECDAFLSHLLLQANPSLPSLLRPTDPLEGEALQSAMRRLIFSLKRSNAIAFVSDLVKVRHQAEQVPGDLDSAQAPPVEAQDEGSNEVTQALMSGQLDNYIQKGGKESANQPVQAESNAPFNVAHPLDTSLPPIPIGPERHRWAEPLFDPTLLLQCGYTERDLETKLSLVEAVQNGARALPTAMPSQIRTSAAWEHVIIGNYAARVEDLGAAICIKLGSVLVDRHHRHPQDPYKSNPTFVKIPDYFSEFKGRPDWISYLGGCIMAKMFFTDNMPTKGFYTKVDYNELGPGMIKQLGSAAEA